MRVLLLCWMLAGCAGGVGPAGAEASLRTEVEVADLQAALAGGAPLIDVRTPGEFASGHVPGAKNIPLDELPARMGELGDPAAEVFVICEVGGRSAQAASSLAAAGRRAVNVKGGTRAWKAAGLPVE